MLTQDQADDLKNALNVWKHSVAKVDVSGRYAERISELEKVIDRETVKPKTLNQGHKHEDPSCAECGHTGELYIHGRCHVSSPVEASFNKDLVTIKCFQCKSLIVQFRVSAV